MKAGLRTLIGSTFVAMAMAVALPTIQAQGTPSTTQKASKTTTKAAAKASRTTAKSEVKATKTAAKAEEKAPKARARKKVAVAETAEAAPAEDDEPGTGDLLEHVTAQDVVTFTGSKSTGLMLKSGKRILEESVPFNMEADSLNFSMLAPESAPGTEEFDLFVKEVVREMTAKAGQKCTAIRRTLVPQAMVDDAIKAIEKRLGGVRVGDPQVEGIRMGPLVGKSQVNEVRDRVEQLRRGSELVFGNPDDFEVAAGDKSKGAFFPTTLLYCDSPLDTLEPHNIEAFGPVNTVMPYTSVDEAIELAKMGRGSLVGSLFTSDDAVARQVTLGTASHHGRLLIINRESAKASTGHGSPLPGLVHGGPGRAGGGEEMAYVRFNGPYHAPLPRDLAP